MLTAVSALLLATACDTGARTLGGRADKARRRALQSGDAGDFVDALHLALMADEPEPLAELADACTPEMLRSREDLAGLVALADYRLGNLSAALEAAASISPASEDPWALEAWVTTRYASGQDHWPAADVTRYASTTPRTIRGLSTAIAVMLTRPRPDTFVAQLQTGARQLERDGRFVPQDLTGGQLQLLREVGTRPLNVVESFGAAPLEMDTVVRLPVCQAFINGEGPFRLVLDSGAGQTLLVSTAIADDLDLTHHAQGTMFGLGGQAAAYISVADRLQVGAITVRRVYTTGMDQDSPLMAFFDGIVGLGVFSGGRAQLDFETGGLTLSPSIEERGPGERESMWLTPSRHLIGELATSHGRAVVFYDTGANMTILSPRWLRSVVPDRELTTMPMPMFGVAGSQGQSQLIAAGTLDFAGRTLDVAGVASDDLDGALGSVIGTRIDILIGMPDFAKMRRWTVDFPRRRMWVDWLESD